MLEDRETEHVYKMSDVTATSINWVWEGRIPLGAVTILEGDGGVGKSYLAAEIASAVSRGRGLPGGSLTTPSDVIYISAEDDPSTVLKPRFEKVGADQERIQLWRENFSFEQKSLSALYRAIEKYDAKLVVIDPVVAFLTGGTDMNVAADVRIMLNPIAIIAKQLQCSILLVRHWNKSVLVQASQRGSGSVDFRNFSRSLLQVIKTDDEAFLFSDKCNYGPVPLALGFRISSDGFDWLGESDLTADSVLMLSREREGGKEKTRDAEDFVREILQGRDLSSQEFQERWKACPISRNGATQFLQSEPPERQRRAV
jgi:hypothetical protein